MALPKTEDAWNPFTPGTPDTARRTSLSTPRSGPTLVESPLRDANPAQDQSRRLYDRIPGPFDGRRVGLLETPVSLYDLSMGGCFVNSLHDQKEGTTIVLKIDLPYEGWITVKAETVYRRLGFGFAVRFVEMSPETEACLERSIRALQNRQPYEE